MLNTSVFIHLANLKLVCCNPTCYDTNFGNDCNLYLAMGNRTDSNFKYLMCIAARTQSCACFKCSQTILLRLVRPIQLEDTVMFPLDPNSEKRSRIWNWDPQMGWHSPSEKVKSPGTEGKAIWQCGVCVCVTGWRATCRSLSAAESQQR